MVFQDRRQGHAANSIDLIAAHFRAAAAQGKTPCLTDMLDCRSSGVLLSAVNDCGRRTLSETYTALDAGFPAPDEAAWRALAEKTLNGAPVDQRLVSKTYDGGVILPLYTTANAKTSNGSPGWRSVFDADRPWDIRAAVDHPDPAMAHGLALAELEGGATSLLINIDPSGVNGVALTSRAGLETLLDGVHLDLAPVALDAAFLGVDAARRLGEVAETRTLKPHLHLHMDPLSAFAAAGSSPGPMAAHLNGAGQAALNVRAETAFLASGRVVHDAGGTEAQEIGFMAAAGLAYLKAGVNAGLDMETALDRIALGLAADAALTDRPTPARIEARSSRRMLSKLDPWVNMLRLTAAGFGAAAGGADAILLDPFTQPLGRPTAFARRQARNTQLVLMEEAHLGRVADPAAGAWFIETLTEEMARKGWAFFQAIEAKGGALEALQSGFVASAVGTARASRLQDVERKKTRILGVTVFRNPDEAAVETDSVDPAPFAKPSPPVALPRSDEICPALTPWRLAEAFEESGAA
jgi:methylmalonyl-CoA mutase